MAEAQAPVSPELQPPTPPQGLSGGPGDPISAPAEKVASQQNQTPAPKEIYMGGRKFNSIEELATYTQELQTKAAVADQIRGVMIPSQPEVDPEEELAEMIYSDPKKAVKMIKGRAVDEAVQIFEQRQAAKATRQDFFITHKDLQGQEDLVDMYYNKMQKELATLPLNAATSKLANAVRARVANIRGEKQATETLSNDNPVVIGSGTTAPKASAQAASKSFLEQLQSMQRRGKK